MDPHVQYLLDRTAIWDTIVRYFNSLDARDWPAMRATLAGTTDLDFSQLSGDPRAALDSDDFVANPCEVTMSNWLRAVYDRADALDAEGYARFFEEDGTFTLANNPPMRGPTEIKGGLTQFFGAIAGMRHDFLRTYQIDDTEIMEAAVTYTRKDGTQVTLPGMTVCVRNQDQIRESRAYIDIGPLFQ